MGQQTLTGAYAVPEHLQKFFARRDQAQSEVEQAGSRYKRSTASWLEEEQQEGEEEVDGQPAHGLPKERWKLHGNLPYVIDDAGRTVWLRGVNLSGNIKTPSFLPTHHPDSFSASISLSFIDRPFPLNQAHEHFARLKSYGYNFLRFLVSWEALEHYGPGVYDMAYVDYVIETLKVAGSYGIKVMIDPHQDVWSRSMGGSGHPTWTSTLVGFDVAKFRKAGAGVLHSQWYESNAHGQVVTIHDDLKTSEDYPHMIWTSNDFKLGAATMFTLFFAGKTFCPDFYLTWKRPGVDEPLRAIHIQDFLQLCHFNAMSALANAIEEAGLHGSVVLGYQTMNEPRTGYIGVSDLTEYPQFQLFKLEYAPTPIQTFLLGIGTECRVNYFRVFWFGPLRTGSKILQGANVWMKPQSVEDMIAGGLKARGGGQTLFDSSNLFQDLIRVSSSSAGSVARGEEFAKKRFEEYQGCIWATCGLYDQRSEKPLMKDYFLYHPLSHKKVDFTEDFWLPFARDFVRYIRRHQPDSIIFLETFPGAEPPHLLRSDNSAALSSPPDQDEIRQNIVFAPHFYDGFTLFRRTLSRFSIEVLSFVRRHKYLFQLLHFGLSGMRTMYEQEFSLLKAETRDLTGEKVPTYIGETGIPMDLDNKRAFKTGDYSEHVRGVDALMTGLERAKLGFAFWTYVADNTHRWGDGWNGEDLSVFSRPPSNLLPMHYKDSTKGGPVPPYDRSYTFRAPSIPGIRKPSSLALSSQPPQRCPTSQPKPCSYQRMQLFHETVDELSLFTRAHSALVRPYPTKTPGEPLQCEFNMKTGAFRYEFQPFAPQPIGDSRSDATIDPGCPNTCDGWKEWLEAGKYDAWTCEVFLPRSWFPSHEKIEVRVETGTQWCWDGLRQTLYWFIPPSIMTEGRPVAIQIRTPVRHYPSSLFDVLYERIFGSPVEPLKPVTYDKATVLHSLPPDLSSPDAIRILRQGLGLEPDVFLDLRESVLTYLESQSPRAQSQDGAVSTLPASQSHTSLKRRRTYQGRVATTDNHSSVEAPGGEGVSDSETAHHVEGELLSDRQTVTVQGDGEVLDREWDVIVTEAQALRLRIRHRMLEVVLFERAPNPRG